MTTKNYKMYDIKKNKETGKLELKHITFNMHPSIIEEGAVQFEHVFSREYARVEYAKLRIKYLNSNISADELMKMELLEKEFEFDENTIFTFDYTGVDNELIGTLFLTMYAHSIILDEMQYDEENGKYSIKAQRISLKLDDFYAKCRKCVVNIKGGKISIEDAVKELKQTYNDAVKNSIINHNAVDGICKKWDESTKEKNTRAFIMGILPHYKITRSNMIDTKSPLSSLANFEKYVAMWLVTAGALVDKKKNNKTNTVTIDSLVANAKKSNAGK